MNYTLGEHLPISLLQRWEIDAQIETLARAQRDNDTVTINATTPPQKDPEDDDDGFILVTKGYNTRNATTTTKPLSMNGSRYTGLPSGKTPVTQKQGSFESRTAKKNRKRTEKKHSKNE